MQANTSLNTLRYALAKQIPDMARGFVIQTHYGEIVIEAEYAPAIMAAVEHAAVKRLSCGGLDE